MLAGTVVHIILTGIVSLIPQNRGYLIRLQDASAAHVPHFACFLAEQPNVTTPVSPIVTAHQESGPTLAAWRIPNGSIKIENRILDNDLASDLRYVLRIADACPDKECGVAKSHYQGTELYIGQGALSATALESYRGRWENEPADRLRSVAGEVCWTFRISEGVLRLSLPDGRGGVTSVSVKAPESGGDIELVLQNVPENDFIPTSISEVPGEDRHAKLYFLQSASPLEIAPSLVSGPQPGPLQHPNHRLDGREIARRVSGLLWSSAEETKRIGGSNCPPALWQGVEGSE